MKTIKCLLIVVFILMLFTTKSFATGNASTYKVTVQNIQLKNDAGSWVTIATPNQVIDIAAVAAGAVAGSFMNDASIPVGNYVNFKVVLSETMVFSGSDGATNITRSGGDVTVTGADAAAASTATWASFPPNATLTENVESHKSSGTPGEVTAHLDLAGDTDGYIEVYAKSDLGDPVSINMNSVVSMYFDFDTQGTVIWTNAGDGNIMFFTPPQEGTQFGITVDGSSITVTADSMRIDF